MIESILVLLFTLLSFLMGVAQFIFGGIIDKVSESIGVSIAAIGQLTTIYSLSAAIGTPIVMISLAKRPLHHILFFGLLSMIIGNGLMFVAPNFSILMVARMLVGLGAGVYGIAAFSIIAEKAKPERRGRDLSMISVGASLALVLGVPFSRAITSLIDWRFIFLGLSILMIIVLIVLIKLLKSTSTREISSIKEQLSYLISKETALLFLVTFSMFLGYSALNTYITPYLLNISGNFGSIISWLLMIVGIASVIGSRLGGVLSDKFGVSNVIEAALFIQALALVVISLFSNIEYIVILALFIWAVAAWTCGPIFNLNINSRFTKGKAILLSINGTMVQFGFAGGAFLGAIIVESVGISNIALFASGVVLLAAVLFWFEKKLTIKIR